MHVRSTFTVLAATAGLLAPTGTASAATAALSAPRIAAHFDLAASQQPENIALDQAGDAYLTFSYAREVAKVTPDGHTRILATLPAPAVANTPNLGRAIVTGIARDSDGTLYIGYATGTADLTGVWALPPGGQPRRIAALPADGLPNGLALDQRTGLIYVADSVLGVVFRIPTHGGGATVWADDQTLKRINFGGANGIKVHNAAVWVTNSDQGTLVRIPFAAHGAAGRAEIRATGLVFADDFAFVGHDDTALVADRAEQVELVRPDGTHSVVLTPADGLQTPTSVAVLGSTVYVTSAAYLTNEDPNLLTAHLEH